MNYSATTLVQKWRQIDPVIRFLLFVFLGIVVFYYVYMDPLFMVYFQNDYVNWNATIAAFALQCMGYECSATATLISSLDGTAINIKRGCDGLEAMAIFGLVLLAYPATLAKKMIGVFSGLSVLFVFNIIRIISLYIVIRHSKFWFDLLHLGLWQCVLIMIALCCCWLWIIWINKTRTYES